MPFTHWIRGALCGLVLAGAGATASAAPLVPISATIVPSVGGTPVVTEGSLANLADGNLDTGYLVRTTPTSGASGFHVRFLYDLPLAGITAVTARVDLVADYGPLISSSLVANFRWGWDALTTNGYIVTPLVANNELVSATVSPILGGTGVDNLFWYSFFDSAGRLSLSFGTGLGFATFPDDPTLSVPISISFREISVEFTLAPTAVPEPATLPLFLGMLGLAFALTRRRAA